MIIEQYGIKLIRVTADDLELIRHWRNQPFIRDTMQFREYITEEMQKEWFGKINNKYNYYFVIVSENKKIGIINCKGTEADGRVAEGGIFIWDKEYWGTPVPVFASLTVLECVFEVFQSGATSLITVARNNERALYFNKMLGYSESENDKQSEFVKLFLTKDNYFKKTCKLKKAAILYCKGEAKLKILGEENDVQVEEINEYLRKNKS
jgi:UDP-4-amino-4,6-dideoxy-N-acetyl-beta-L-altrosamine N-acetyltransferase